MAVMKLIIRISVFMAFACLLGGCAALSGWYGDIYEALSLRNQQTSLEQRDPPGINQPMTYQQYEYELKQLDQKKTAD